MLKTVLKSKKIYIPIIVGLFLVLCIVIGVVVSRGLQKGSENDDNQGKEEIILEDDREFNEEGLNSVEDDDTVKEDSASAGGSWEGTQDNNEHNNNENHNGNQSGGGNDADTDTKDDDENNDENVSDDLPVDDEEWGAVY